MLENPLLAKIVRKIQSSAVYDVAIKTPLQFAPVLTAQFNNNIYLKREDLQPVFSFKCRGAYQKIYNLKKNKANIKGVITASAGNHAQGVALAAQKLGFSATIVMPLVTPSIKVQAVKKLGAKVVLHGDYYDNARDMAYQLATKDNLVFIHPFDDLDVIVGQGTIGLEIKDQLVAKLNQANFSGKNCLIFIPVGGGGLIAGVGAYLKNQLPDCKIIAVEPKESPTLYHSLKNKQRTILPKTGVFVDGVSVKQIGKHNFPIIQNIVDDCLLVNNDEICAAIEDIFNNTRSISEPSGALAVAGAKQYIAHHCIDNHHIVSIVSGANLNFDRLRYIAERSKFGSQKELILAVAIPEKAGSYREFCKTLSDFSITEFNYRYADQQIAQVFVGIALDEDHQASAIIAALKAKGYQVLNLIDNETAKTHIRHMVGGKNSAVKNERIVSFNFPERKGALMDFLNQLHGWNISLFHYRSQGAPYGEVLVGIQVPDNQQDEFHQFLENLGYDFRLESDNKACKIFL